MANDLAICLTPGHRQVANCMRIREAQIRKLLQGGWWRREDAHVRECRDGPPVTCEWLCGMRDCSREHQRLVARAHNIAL